jgi:hypothetical protein
MSHLGHLLLASVVGLVFSQPLAAISIRQEAPATAVLKGAVFDSGREAVILDQTVVVQNLQTEQVWKLITDDAGAYSVNVPAGTYSLTTEGNNDRPFSDFESLSTKSYLLDCCGFAA